MPGTAMPPTRPRPFRHVSAFPTLLTLPMFLMLRGKTAD
ncbi:hypothetical protein SBI_08146 [Streptomyces bingchenggensis BCW-1]|uniref:Uncharacterized protein n=1 Tax=Streptomyces bingchenggensis (strain BCW-1) TaxID=749414 RepID=D7CI86_STRBB|nr:hypothetical protein SBI_08146 [Streptomyces bingchenggensis BCW-1]